MSLEFVDQSPTKNTAYFPSDSTETPSTSISSNPVAPEGFWAKVGFYFQRVKQYKDERFMTLKPWSEFFDRTKFSAPGKVEAFSRANKNVAYFYSNYVVLATLTSSYVLVSNLMFSLSMLIALAFYYFIRSKTTSEEPISIFGRTMSATQAYSALVLFSLLSFYATDGSSAIFWLLLCGVGSVLTHAMSREPVNDLPIFSYV